ncbi:hypothetical protein THAOC_03418 [Thalassiosira oceanica]|uniref:Uncharacterized protein n=1 Tax=Thalassiosira oceanica TaxID=159749 RepID=K0TPT9_THAOC|nr:hypothetical protein THAOC_03418 [Thalassiosira oceanica]|eukprot:EJK74877.1 hypothetical protein THAOC_03418 [Thalassiosira oceanica]
MAGRRRRRRKGSRGGSSDAACWIFFTASAAACCLLFLSISLDLNGRSKSNSLARQHTALVPHYPLGGSIPDQDENVRAGCIRTCDERLNSAAANSHLPSSISSSISSPTGPALDYLLQLRDAQDQQRTFASFQKHGKDGLQAEAPRRLPPLIKLLTGFGPNDGKHGRPSNMVIATRERAPFNVPRISGNKPTDEEFLRSVAVSAATAVWSKSRTLFGNNRMSRVNLEWDEALRWIAVAGWDRRHTIQSSSELGSRRREHEAPIGEGLEHFVNDLEKLLETCLSTCLDGEVNFEGNLAGPEDSAIGTTVLKSVVGWFIGAAMPTTSPEASRMTTRMLMIATWSVAAYAINSSLLWLSPILANWYSTVRRKENPDWLLDHERESQAVRKMKSKHRKKKRRQSAHRSGKAIIAEGALKPQTQTFSVEDRRNRSSDTTTVQREQEFFIWQPIVKQCRCRAFSDFVFNGALGFIHELLTQPKPMLANSFPAKRTKFAHAKSRAEWSGITATQGGDKYTAYQARRRRAGGHYSTPPTAEFDAVEEDKMMEERLGSLLDDEFENDDIDALLQSGMESLSAEESTLNPSAAPFVSKPGLTSLSPGPVEEKKGWKTEQSSLVSATKIAGVYGGSVW